MYNFLVLCEFSWTNNTRMRSGRAIANAYVYDIPLLYTSFSVAYI